MLKETVEAATAARKVHAPKVRRDSSGGGGGELRYNTRSKQDCLNRTDSVSISYLSFQSSHNVPQVSFETNNIIGNSNPIYRVASLNKVQINEQMTEDILMSETKDP
jgi:hypothetical protein